MFLLFLLYSLSFHVFFSPPPLPPFFLENTDFHPLFVRGKPDMCLAMTRTKLKGRVSGTKSSKKERNSELCWGETAVEATVENGATIKPFVTTKKDKVKLSSYGWTSILATTNYSEDHSTNENNDDVANSFFNSKPAWHMNNDQNRGHNDDDDDDDNNADNSSSGSQTNYLSLVEQAFHHDHPHTSSWPERGTGLSLYEPRPIEEMIERPLSYRVNLHIDDDVDIAM